MSTSRESLRETLFKNPRTGGTGLVVVAVWLLYTHAIKPVQDAMDGVETVKGLSSKYTIAGAVALVFGLVLLIGGQRIGRLMHPAPGASKVPSVIISTVMVVTGLGVYFGVKSYVESLGYTFHR